MSIVKRTYALPVTNLGAGGPGTSGLPVITTQDGRTLSNALTTHRSSQLSGGYVAGFPLPVPIGRKPWQLQSLAVAAQLYGIAWTDINSLIGPTFFPPFPPFGKATPIVAGFSPSNPPTSSTQLPWQGTWGANALPQDGTNLFTLWDPATDTVNGLAPLTQGGPGAKYITPTDNFMRPLLGGGPLSSPVEITPGSQTYFWVYQAPYVMQNVELWLAALSYTMIYDDGL